MGDHVIGQMGQQAKAVLRPQKTELRAAEAPLRVLIVAPSLDILGGQAVQAARLVGQLGQEPLLETSFLPINPRLPGLLGKLQTIKYVRTIVTSVFYVAALLLRVRKYDVIHIFSASYLSFVISQTPAILIAKLFRKKIILNYHSGEAEDHLRRWPSAVATMRLVDVIVAPSGYLVDVFGKFGFRARSISNMVDTSRFRYRARKPCRPVFLSNRNLEPMYNVGCILRAFALIQQRFPDARLTVAGDGSQRGKLKRLASKLCLQNIQFIGRVANERMETLYGEADIYLNSSNIDNMPGSIIEAFASGLPVVTTNAGGIPYIVTNEETGLIVKPDDHLAIARSAIRLIEDQDFAARVAARAREECNQYGLDAVRGEWVKLYHEIAGVTQTECDEEGVETNEPLRVLIVAPSLDILGGQAVQAARLVGQLGQEPLLETSFLPINPRLPGLLGKLQTIKYVRTIVTSVFYVAALLLRVRKYDVIHIFSASYLSFVISQTPAILIAKLFRKKIILNYRSGEAEDHLRRWPSAVATMRLVDVIVAPSGYLVDVFGKFGFRARSISNMVDANRFRYRERRPFRPVFLSNRNLEPMYNVGCILRAFALIQQRFPDARLTVAGDGSQRAMLEQLARDLGLRNTEFAGRVANERMETLYGEADIYLNSSNIDNMPGSIIEAFASGLPVVTTNAGGIPYIVTNEETGLIVKPDDHLAIARSAIRLIEDQDFAARVAARAREECNQYGLDAVRGEWIELYHDVAGRRLTERKEQKVAA